MYNLFIVDDEEVVRNGIRQLITCVESKYTICGEASDGELAFPMIQELKPDIIITDIRMPFMDGLELSKIVRKKMPWIQIIILSGHDEFEYARQAISLGVSEYILKPITAEQFIAVLDKTCNKIEETKEYLYNRENISKWNDYEQNAIRDHFFLTLISDSTDTTEIYSHAEKLSIDLVARYFLVLCIDPGKDSPIGQLNIILEEVLRDRDDIFFTLEHGYDRYILILKENESKTVLENGYEIAQVIKHKSDTLLGTNLSIGIGNIVPRISMLSESYQSARRILGEHFSVQEGYILSHEDLKHGFSIDIDFSSEVPLQEKLRHATISDIDLILDRYFGDINNTYTTSLLYRTYIFTDLIVASKRLLSSIDGKIPQILINASNSDFFVDILRDYNSSMDFAHELMVEVINARDQAQGFKYGEEIKKARECIHANYSDENLSLNTVASQVGFSPNHFSTIFSQQMGRTFIEYLTNYRIEKAKNMLTHTDLKIIEIAEMIGYSESQYFSYIFKKT